MMTVLRAAMAVCCNPARAMEDSASSVPSDVDAKSRPSMAAHLPTEKVALLKKDPKYAGAVDALLAMDPEERESFAKKKFVKQSEITRASVPDMGGSSTVDAEGKEFDKGAMVSVRFPDCPKLPVLHGTVVGGVHYRKSGDRDYIVPIDVSSHVSCGTRQRLQKPDLAAGRLFAFAPSKYLNVGGRRYKLSKGKQAVLPTLEGRFIANYELPRSEKALRQCLPVITCEELSDDGIAVLRYRISQPAKLLFETMPVSISGHVFQAAALGVEAQKLFLDLFLSAGELAKLPALKKELDYLSSSDKVYLPQGKDCPLSERTIACEKYNADFTCLLSRPTKAGRKVLGHTLKIQINLHISARYDGKPIPLIRQRLPDAIPAEVILRSPVDEKTRRDLARSH